MTGNFNARAAQDRAKPFQGIDAFEPGEKGAQWTLRLRADEPVFEGHYPGNPILPGIYTLESVQQGIERLYAGRGRRVTMTRVKSMRFLAPFAPGDLMRVQAQVEERPGGEVLASASILRNGDKAAQAKIYFRIEDDQAC
jgi:3-hydroxyacyl-[acyl-carrier-protein] dehydratase